MTSNGMAIRHKMFRGTLITWDALLAQAAEFATRVGRDRIVSISHSAAGGDGVVAVWYLAEAAQESRPS